MKNLILNSLKLSVILMFATGCQKVITVQLDNSPSQLVIEAALNDISDTQKVILSKSTSYFDNLPQQFVSGAAVTISDNAGNTFSFKEDKPGIYINTTVKGVPGRVYTLGVNSGGQIYTAVSTMPVPVPIDSVKYQPSQSGLFGGGGNGHKGGDSVPTYQIHMYFKDPASVQNYYRIDAVYLDQIIPDSLADDDPAGRIRILDDQLVNGQPVNYFLRRLVLPGDSVQVTLRSIDKTAYSYYGVINSLINQNSQDASPGNPPTNVKGGALGLFTAYSARKVALRVR